MKLKIGKKMKNMGYKRGKGQKTEASFINSPVEVRLDRRHEIEMACESRTAM